MDDFHKAKINIIDSIQNNLGIDLEDETVPSEEELLDDINKEIDKLEEKFGKEEDGSS